MATPKFIIEVKAKGFGSLQQQLKQSDDAMTSFGNNAKRQRRATKGFERGMGALRNTMLLYAFAVGAATKVTGSFIRNASKFQDVKTRLVGLTGSVVQANRAFDTFNSVAATTPFSLDDVVNAGAQLKAFGADAEDLIKPITDLAAFMGTTATEAANSFGRAFAGGAGAADILRERGILNIIKSSQGIADLSKTTLPQFREALINTLQEPTIGIAGSTDRLSQTFTGAMSNMRDSMTRFTAAVGTEALPAITGLSKQVRDLFDAATEMFVGFTGTEAEKMLLNLKKMGVESEQLATLEGIVFTEKAEENIANINKAIGDLLQNTPNLVQDFTKFGKLIRPEQSDFIAQLAKRFLNLDTRIQDVSIPVENISGLLDVLKQMMNESKINAEGFAESVGKTNQATSKATQAEADHFVALASLVALLTQQQNIYTNLKDTLAELAANQAGVTATVVTFESAMKELDGTGKFALRTFNRFGDAFAEAALTAKSFEEAGRNAVRAVAAEILSKAATFGLMKLFFATPLKGLSFGQFLLGSLGIKHDGGPVQKFATGGMIQGRDNVPILAEAGEFVIKRDSAQSIGLSALNQMNETGQVASNINVHIHGGIVQEDYVRNELLPAMARQGVTIA